MRNKNNRLFLNHSKLNGRLSYLLGLIIILSLTVLMVKAQGDVYSTNSYNDAVKRIDDEFHDCTKRNRGNHQAIQDCINTARNDKRQLAMKRQKKEEQPIDNRQSQTTQTRKQNTPAPENEEIRAIQKWRGGDSVDFNGDALPFTVEFTDYYYEDSAKGHKFEGMEKGDSYITVPNKDVSFKSALEKGNPVVTRVVGFRMQNNEFHVSGVWIKPNGKSSEQFVKFKTRVYMKVRMAH